MAWRVLPETVQIEDDVEVWNVILPVLEPPVVLKVALDPAVTEVGLETAVSEACTCRYPKEESPQV
jgi:hypothetical protein